MNAAAVMLWAIAALLCVLGGGIVRAEGSAEGSGADSSGAPAAYSEAELRVTFEMADLTGTGKHSIA